MALPIPAANQPIDYDFINTIVSEITRIDGLVSSLSYNTQSSINGKTIKPNEVVVFGTKITFPGPGSATFSEQIVNFAGVSFKEEPIVTVTANTGNKNSSWVVAVDSVTSQGCVVRIIWGTNKPTGNTTFALLAVGQRATVV